MSDRPLIANLICGSPERTHDFDLARIRLAEAVYAAGGIWADTTLSFDDTARLEAADLLVTYTAGVSVGPAECQALRQFLERGGRWFALHATNAGVKTPAFTDILGSSFIAHPPYSHFDVAVTQPTDPLVAGLEPFEVDDELYLIDPASDVEVLLQARWGGEVRGQAFDERVWPLMYRRRTGKGGVVYLALGHANRPFEKATPTSPEAPDRRGPWESAAFRELIRRGVEWAAGRRPL